MEVKGGPLELFLSGFLEEKVMGCRISMCRREMVTWMGFISCHGSKLRGLSPIAPMFYGVTENIWAPLQSQGLCPQVGFFKGRQPALGLLEPFPPA
ncbi:hypothetical protein TNCV_1288421 [Trichonephila clavipes]|nr:hypothetical protein TNCV_1288421 [Trichonephila clavipes]